LPNQSELFSDYRALVLQIVPYVLYASIVMILSTFILPRAQSTSPSSPLSDVDPKLPLPVFLVFWLCVLAWSLYFIFSNGKFYIRWPRLVPLEFAPNAVGEDITESENGDGTVCKRQVKVSPPKSPTGALGMLFDRWIPGRGGSEKVRATGEERKDHAE